MAFGYVPDYAGKSFLKDLYVRIIGYPYPPRRNEAALIFALLKPTTNEKILDIGCGDGVWYNELRKKGDDVIGIDLSSRDLEKLKERADKMGIVPNVFNANAQKMPFNSASFDKAYSISTFEHIENDEETFSEVSRVLKPGGSFVISVPIHGVPLLTKLAVKMPVFIKKLIYNDLIINAENWQKYIENFNQYYCHYRNYTPAELKQRIEASEFEVEKKTYNCRFFGSCIWSLYHTLKIFQRKKSKTTDYSFKNETVFALTLPVFYLFFLLDRLLFWKKGQIIILKLKKHEKKPDNSQFN